MGGSISKKRISKIYKGRKSKIRSKPDEELSQEKEQPPTQEPEIQVENHVDEDTRYLAETTDDVKILVQIEKELDLITRGMEGNSDSKSLDINKLKLKLESIEDSDPDTAVKKSVILRLLQNTENSLSKEETEAKLQSTEVQLKRFIEHLKSLKKDVESTVEIDETVYERKNSIVRKIEAILASQNSVDDEIVPDEVSGNIMALQKIEEEVEKMKLSVISLVGVVRSEDYIEIDKALNDFSLKLHNFGFEESSIFEAKKIEILEKIKKLRDDLDNTVKQFEEITEIRQKITEIIAKIISFDQIIGDEEFEKLQEEFNRIKEDLEVIKPNKGLLIKKREECFKKLTVCEEKLKHLSKFVTL